MNILLYGHSQTGGMGLDLRDLLVSKGNTVKVVVHNGWNDYALLEELPNVLKKGEYQRVYLFVGGNLDSPTPEQINEMVNYCGGPTVAQAILPPYNSKKTTSEVFNDKSLKGYVNRTFLEKNGVTVWVGRFPSSDFSDGIHVKHKSASSKQFANMIYSESENHEFNYQNAAFVSLSIIAVIAVIVILSKRSKWLGLN